MATHHPLGDAWWMKMASIVYLPTISEDKVANKMHTHYINHTQNQHPLFNEQVTLLQKKRWQF